jgi:hypothetical protein
MPQLESKHTIAPQRSHVWIFWALVTALLVVAAFTHPLSLVAAIATGCYARYLYRGGSIVFWGF